MRNLDDFRAEVYRRHGEAKKLQKKQRQAFVLTCVPLVLGFSLLFYPGFMRAESKDAAIESCVNSAAPISYKITALQGDTVTVLEAGSDGAKQITSLLFKDSLVYSDLKDEAESKPKEEAQIESSTDSSQSKEILTFVLTDENGKNIRFILEDEWLLRLDTGKETRLLQEEINLLYEAIKNGTNE